MQAIEVTIRMPEPLYQKLQRRAREMARPLDQLLVEAIRHTVEEPVPAQRSERELVLAVLKESGMREPIGPEWTHLLSGRPLKTHAELRASLQGVAPLSEDIIAMRGEP